MSARHHQHHQLHQHLHQQQQQQQHNLHHNGPESPISQMANHHLPHLHLQQQQQEHNLHLAQQQSAPANQTNSSSNASTPNSNNNNTTNNNNNNTSFLIKNILCYEGQKRKQRKARTAFSDHQLKELEASFEARKYLTVQDRVKLAHDLRLSDTQVKTWYQNRRTKHKRQSAVGLELLQDVNYFHAYQSAALQQSQWFLGHCAAPSTQINFAAAAAMLAAHAQAVNPQQQQVSAAQVVQSLVNHQAAAAAASQAVKPTLSPPASPQDHRLLEGSNDSSDK